MATGVWPSHWPYRLAPAAAAEGGTQAAMAMVDMLPSLLPLQVPGGAIDDGGISAADGGGCVIAPVVGGVEQVAGEASATMTANLDASNERAERIIAATANSGLP